MSLRNYAVVPNGEVWSVEHLGCKAGRFQTRSEALKCAARLAREAYQLGEDVAVKVMDRQGRPRQERAFDHGART